MARWMNKVKQPQEQTNSGTESKKKLNRFPKQKQKWKTETRKKNRNRTKTDSAQQTRSNSDFSQFIWAQQRFGPSFNVIIFTVQFRSGWASSFGLLMFHCTLCYTTTFYQLMKCASCLYIKYILHNLCQFFDLLLLYSANNRVIVTISNPPVCFL